MIDQPLHLLARDVLVKMTDLNEAIAKACLAGLKIEAELQTVHHMDLVSVDRPYIELKVYIELFRSEL